VIEFSEQKNGYNKKEVDGIISEMTKFNNVNFEKYFELLAKYTKLEREYKKVDDILSNGGFIKIDTGDGYRKVGGAHGKK
jgi:hypothetical protein